MVEVMRKKGILVYLVLSFAVAWLLWELAIRLTALADNSILLQFVALPGAFAPAVAAIVVRKWVTGEGFADAGLKPRLRKGWRHYLLAWLLPLPVVGTIVLLAAALRIDTPDWTLSRYAVALGAGELPTLPGWLWAALPVQLLLSALLTTFLVWGEEFGWRGYLQPRLVPGRPLVSAVLTGSIWSLWHLPLNLRGYNFPGQPFLGMLVFTVTTVLLSIIFGWLQEAAGSVWAPSLAHGATNTIGGSLTLLLYAGVPGWLWVSYVGILSWLPLGALCLWIIWRGLLPDRSPSAIPVADND